MMAELVTDGRQPRECELTNLTKSCILHSLHLLLRRDRKPHDPEQIQKFCRELCEKVMQSNSSKDKSSSLFFTSVPGVSLREPLQIDVEEFEKGLLTARDIFLKIEQKLVECIKLNHDGDFDHDSLFRVCWKVYRVEKRPDSLVTEFSTQHPESDDCMYYLWLVFNAILSPEESDEIRIPVRCLDEVMRRVFDLCGHECSRDELVYNSSSEMLEYPEYLKAIANYNVKFDLKKTLTCEVIHDLKDEIVDAVLKKSYITKKGHKLRTWRRRWFVLKKTIMRYYESKEKPVLKGQMMINSNTVVRERDDIGRRIHCFEVVCGLTKKPFEMSADDEKSRHEWILAIRKAIRLAKILAGKEDKEMRESPSNPHLSNFYLIKFGASQSIIPKWEGGVKQVIDCSQSNFSDSEDEENSTSKLASDGPTPGSVVSTSSADSLFIRDNTEYKASQPAGEYPASAKSMTFPQGGQKGSPAYSRRQRFRSNPSGQMSLMGSCDHIESQDSVKVAEFESTAINGVKEITNSAAAESSDGLVQSGTSTKSTEEAATPPVALAARNDDVGSFGPEDAPSIITDESLISRPHAQTFLDKMQNLAFDSGSTLDFGESYCDL